MDPLPRCIPVMVLDVRMRQYAPHFVAPCHAHVCPLEKVEKPIEVVNFAIQRLKIEFPRPKVPEFFHLWFLWAASFMRPAEKQHISGDLRKKLPSRTLAGEVLTFAVPTREGGFEENAIKRTPIPKHTTLLYSISSQVEELPETASRTIAAEWGAQTAGGSHIHPDWKKNPCFHLKLRATGPAKVRKIISTAFAPTK